MSWPGLGWRCELPFNIHNDFFLYQQRGTFGTAEYPGLGAVGVVEPPFKFSDARAFVRGRAPEVGEHTRAILARWLGKTDDEVDELMQSGVLFESAAGGSRAAEPPASGAEGPW